MAKYTAEIKETAKKLFIKGWTIPEIGKETGVTERTLYNWRDAEQWEAFAAPDTVEQGISRRFNALIEKENKTDAELKELTALGTVLGDLRVNLAKANLLQSQATAISKGNYIPPELLDSAPTERDLKQANDKKPNQKRKRGRPPKNDISGITQEQLDEFRQSHFFEYQLLWHEQKSQRTRFILKSRQIGATYYFAYEAFEDAVLTGDNQIFLSASRDQAEVFKAYIIAIAKEHFDVELKGHGAIILSNGAEIRFLSTNSRTAQSYHGHLYVDEVFWIPDFEKLWKVASGMAAHKKWRRTLFSTPSAKSHQAFPMWSGEKFNSRFADNKKVEFDSSHKALMNGLLGADKIWRHIVTVKDAESMGCDLFDIEELQVEYTKDDFANLFMCKFIDDAHSVFSLKKLMKCMIDIDAWADYHPDAARPFGNRPVALGYDPSRTRDNATLAILAIPLTPGEKWRVLRHVSFTGQNFQYQANRIKEIYDSHSVKHIGIDVTGIGHGVFELVEQFFPRATPITYSVHSKTELVVKAIDVIENDRLQYPAGDKVITQSFMMITKTTTGSGVITYAANRSNTTGHADVAWSVMHALNYEDIAPRRQTRVSL
ncbi:terminase large subunit domain-containing protein [Methylophaga sp. OBS4]|uniref:terminase large subunit domain-containing protein n=1 Tax=Methylophaga sp. OBS4 TaxID=2991935 RepID=UPI0022585FE5|nr:terminase family protein [Methylophaga sp. OBS4]MCX4187179.1 terminase family protein [Methylophaga sp. OBS4]